MTFLRPVANCNHMRKCDFGNYVIICGDFFFTAARNSRKTAKLTRGILPDDDLTPREDEIESYGHYISAYVADYFISATEDRNLSQKLKKVKVISPWAMSDGLRRTRSGRIIYQTADLLWLISQEGRSFQPYPLIADFDDAYKVRWPGDFHLDDAAAGDICRKLTELGDRMEETLRQQNHVDVYSVGILNRDYRPIMDGASFFSNI